MRVVIVTGTEPHHKNLCAAITGAYNVVGIIHPAKTPSRPTTVARKLIRQARSHGWSIVIMSMLGKLACRIQKQRPCSGKPFATAVDFREGAAAYDRIPKSLVHLDYNVRRRQFHDLVRSLEPDVTLCLGGPVYPQSFIDACPIMLNFHSGISPIYNGTASIQFAFANGHLHLCGGTLMVMEARVDGGRILGHFFPEIKSGDSPDSLFAKTALGASIMYVRILEYLDASGGPLQHIAQSSPLFYTRGVQLSWWHRQMIAVNLREDIAARFERVESLMEYWREPTERAAYNAYRSTLENLLWAPDKPTWG